MAVSLLAHVSRECPATVVDFAAGTGRLLMAAGARWADARLFASDIDLRTVASLRKRQPDWTVSRCDFLQSASREKAEVCRRLKGSATLVLLNPPFSSRGASRCEVNVDNLSMNCSKAMAFVMTAIHYLASDGELVAILPASVLNSDKDAAARSWLSRRFSFVVVEEQPAGAFESGRARTVVVRMKPGREVGLEQRTDSSTVRSRGVIRVVRGKTPIYSLNGGTSTVPLVHTTDFGVSSQSVRWAPRSAAMVVGPSILLPRVGLPIKSKTCVRRGQPFALSDCVIALEAPSFQMAKVLHEDLVSNWDALLGRYGGSCAPYITLRALRGFLAQLGYSDSACPDG
jgi:tRNA1(Val) A37 N6-methylase TrmN6